MVMTDGFTSLLPDMLLGVEVRASWRVIQEFQMRVLREHLLDRRAKMPGGTIQEQDINVSETLDLEKILRETAQRENIQITSIKPISASLEDLFATIAEDNT